MIYYLGTVNSKNKQVFLLFQPYAVSDRTCNMGKK